MVHIRPLRPDEAHGLAALFPDGPEPEAPSVILAADSPAGESVGWGALCDQLHGYPLPPGQRFVRLYVRPDARGRGVGRELAGELLRLAAEPGTAGLAAQPGTAGLAAQPGTASLSAHVDADDPRALAFAERLGFRPDYQMLEARIDLAGFQPDLWQHALAVPALGGIRITSMAEEADPEAALRQIWAVDHRVSADVPQWSGVVVPLDQYRRDVLEAPGYRPAGLFLARDGQRAVGMCGTTVEPDGTGYTWFMGVDRAYRGRGVALALKLLTLRWAKETGLTSLLTHNNNESAGIVGLNRKLGYRITGRTQYLLFERGGAL